MRLNHVPGLAAHVKAIQRMGDAKRESARGTTLKLTHHWTQVPQFREDLQKEAEKLGLGQIQDSQIESIGDELKCDLADIIQGYNRSHKSPPPVYVNGRLAYWVRFRLEESRNAKTGERTDPIQIPTEYQAAGPRRPNRFLETNVHQEYDSLHERPGRKEEHDPDVIETVLSIIHSSYYNDLVKAHADVHQLDARLVHEAILPKIRQAMQNDFENHKEYKMKVPLNQFLKSQLSLHVGAFTQQLSEKGPTARVREEEPVTSLVLDSSSKLSEQIERHRDILPVLTALDRLRGQELDRAAMKVKSQLHEARKEMKTVHGELAAQKPEQKEGFRQHVLFPAELRLALIETVLTRLNHQRRLEKGGLTEEEHKETSGNIKKNGVRMANIFRELQEYSRAPFRLKGT